MKTSYLCTFLSLSFVAVVRGGKPPFWEKAKTARWLVHSLDYGVLSTTSVMYGGAPFGNPQSFADGGEKEGNGQLFFYTSDMDASMQDVKTNPNVSFTLSEEMLGNKCTESFWDGHDGEDPRCVRLTFSGTWRGDLSDKEIAFANASLFSRHAEMAMWPEDHHFKFATIDITDIWLIDMFGGASNIAPLEYFSQKTVTSVDKPTDVKPPNGAPAIDDKVGTARWLVHETTFGVLSTASAHLGGVAFGNPQSFCDGSAKNGTGALYFYVSDLDASMQDIAQNPECSFTITEEFGHDACRNESVDPEDPRCTRLVFTGKMADIADAAKADEAKTDLFDRHPAMKKWPADHSWKVVTMDIEHIWMIDNFGGASVIDVKEYFAYAQ